MSFIDLTQTYENSEDIRSWWSGIHGKYLIAVSKKESWLEGIGSIMTEVQQTILKLRLKEQVHVGFVIGRSAIVYLQINTPVIVLFIF